MITYTIEYKGKIEIDAENIDDLDDQIFEEFDHKGLNHYEIVEQSDEW